MVFPHVPRPPNAFGAHLRLVVAWLALAALGTTAWLAHRWDPAQRRRASARTNLAAAIRATRGLLVDPADLVVAGGVPSIALGALRYRHVFFLGRRQTNRARDLYWALARITPEGVVLSLRSVVNVSQTPAMDESRFVVSGPYVAYPITTGQGVGAVSVVDVRGASAATRKGLGRLRRWAAGITNLQETGHWAGLARHSVEPRSPLRSVALRWIGPGRLEISGPPHGARPARAVLDCPSGRLLVGAGAFVYRPPVRGTKPLFNWLVDTVRRLPFVGPRRIEQAEVLVYSLRDWFRRRFGTSPLGGVGPVSTQDAAITMASREKPYQPRSGTIRAPNWPPPPLRPILSNPHPREGRWSAVPSSIIRYNPNAPPPLLSTFIHPDPARRYSGVGVLLWDPRQVALGMVAGTKEPLSTTGLRGWGVIPRDDHLDRVIAAFNGGFQTMHGEWGMMARGRLIREPARWAATVATDRSGGLVFGTWEATGHRVPPDLYSFRQNLAPMVEDGAVNPLRNLYWGVAVRSQREKIHIVRSGLCLTREGFGAYLWGKAVSLATLARAMQMARCQYGMQMDINRTNASLELYRFARRVAVKTPMPRTYARGGHRTRGVVPNARGWVFWARHWLPEMYSASFPRYIRRTWRDFMYLALKPILPGPDLSPRATPPIPGEGQWTIYAPEPLPAPFPPLLVLTSLRPDPSRPDSVVQIVKMDPRGIGFQAETGELRHPPKDHLGSRTLATLRFPQGALPSHLAVGDRVFRRGPSRRGSGVWVDRFLDSQTAPLARAGLRSQAGAGRTRLMAIGGLPLRARAPQDAQPSDPGSFPPPARHAGRAGRSRRASALAADAAGHLCYAVGPAGPAASALLAAALSQAGCQGGIRLPDLQGGGPLVLGPEGGAYRLLPGDRPARAGSGVKILIRRRERPSGRRFPKVRSRPDQVRFGISKQEALRIYRQRSHRSTPSAP